MVLSILIIGSNLHRTGDLTKHVSFKNFWDIWKYADWSIVFLRISATLFKDRSDICEFKDWSKFRLILELLKLEWRKFVKISAFSLILHDGISESWQAFDASKFKISFKTSVLSTHLKKIEGSFYLLLLWWVCWGDFCIFLSLLKRVPECFLPMDRNYCN